MKPASDRPLTEWAARWIFWLLAVGVTAVISAVASFALAQGVLGLLGQGGVTLDGRTGSVYGLTIALMVAPVPVLWVSFATAPAGRWLVTAAVAAVGLLLSGLPGTGQGWLFLLLEWIPSGVLLGILWRNTRARRA